MLKLLLYGSFVFLWCAGALAREGQAQSQAQNQAQNQTKTTHCWVVTGLNEDLRQNATLPALVNDPLQIEQTSILAGKKCEIFRSWEELLNHYRTQVEGKFDPKGNQFFIYQGAHGGAGGGAACDGGYAQSEMIVTALTQIAASYQTGAFLNSCFSGNTLQEKLMREQEGDHAGLRAIENLCVITGSTFNSVSYTQNQAEVLQNLRPHETMEDLFRKLPDGLISSAKWELLVEQLNRSYAKKISRLKQSLAALEGQGHADCGETSTKRCKVRRSRSSELFGSGDSLFGEEFGLAPMPGLSGSFDPLGSSDDFGEIWLYSLTASPETQRKAILRELGERRAQFLRLSDEKVIKRLRKLNVWHAPLVCDEDEEARKKGHQDQVRRFVLASLSQALPSGGPDRQRRAACLNFHFENPGWAPQVGTNELFWRANDLIRNGGKIEQIAALLKQMPSLPRLQVGGQELIWAALDSKRVDLFNLLLERGANPNSSRSNYSLFEQVVQQMDLFESYVEDPFLKILLKHTDVNRQGPGGTLPIHYAAQMIFGGEELVKVLIAHGANPLAKDAVGRSVEELLKAPFDLDFDLD